MTYRVNTGGGGGGGVTSGTFAARPAPSTAGRVYAPTDGFALYVDTGTTWQSFGPVRPFTAPPLVSALTWINQGSCTATDNHGVLSFFAPSEGNTNNNRHCLVQSAPSTPYTFTVMMEANLYPFQFALAGIVCRESGTGKLIEFSSYVGSSAQLFLQVHKLGSPTTDSGSYLNVATNPAMSSNQVTWYQIVDDGTNLTFNYSNNGTDYIQWFQVSRTDFMTGGPNQIGLIFEAITSAGGNQIVRGTVHHWLAA